MLLPSLHDYFLVSYEVDCEGRRIRLRAKPDMRAGAILSPPSGHVIEFSGVEAYSFKNDVFGNVIFSLTEVSVEKILLDHGREIEDGYRVAGAPGSWAADLAKASKMLGAKGLMGFVLSSSYGLSGWILAKKWVVL
jgi:hypothetical protein